MNKVTGKKITGIKAPQLKRLGQWLMENPMYEVDPKWTESFKEKHIFPSADLYKKFMTNPAVSNTSMNISTNSNSKKTNKSSQVNNSSSNINSNNASAMAPLSFPGLSPQALAGLNSNLLSSLTLGQFDPKNNPLLLPFAGMSNLNALNNMAGLTNMNLFANLANLGISGLSGLETHDSTTSTTASATTATNATSTSTSAAKSKVPKTSEMSHTKPKSGGSSTSISTPSLSTLTQSPATSGTAASTSLPSHFPFLFPNPSLLYTPLGLGALNPFSMPPGMSSAYDVLAQQCGLISNANLPITNTLSRSHAKTSTSTKSSTITSSSATNAAHHSTHKTSKNSGDQHEQSSSALQNLLLPQDNQFLESLSSMDSFKQKFEIEVAKKEDKKKIDLSPSPSPSNTAKSHSPESKYIS